MKTTEQIIVSNETTTPSSETAGLSRLKSRRNRRRIVLTGGGSTGHVSVNLALIPGLLAEGWQVDYIGSASGIERELIAPLPGVRYHAVSTGKLRRYADFKNLTDAFRVSKGLFQAAALLRKLRPHVVFSKGGFVSVPIVIGAWLNRIPVIIHESDVTPGLANRIAMPFTSAICTTFPETANYVRKRSKVTQAGALVRPELLSGNAEQGRQLCGFRASKPVLLIMGGSLGSRRINDAVREALPELLQHYQVVHLCGKGQLPLNAGQITEDSGHALSRTSSANDRAPRNDASELGAASSGYRAFEYLSEELPDVLAMADLVLSRAGSNAIFELLALKKPMLLVPLPLSQSRGDQLRNAASFESAGLCRVLQEENLNAAAMLEQLAALQKHQLEYRERMSASLPADPLPLLHRLIADTARKGK